MDSIIEVAKGQAIEWTRQYGYHAVVPSLLVDPAGVPWAWIFLLLLASEAGKNLFVLFAYGCAVLSVTDHALYWLGVWGEKSALPRLFRRFPVLQGHFENAENAVRQNVVWTIIFGRYLPFVGRWIGVGAGLARVPYAKFALCDAFGVGITVVGFGSLAYWLGRKTLNAPWFHQALLGAFIGGSLLTLLIVVWKARASKRLAQVAD